MFNKVLLAILVITASAHDLIEEQHQHHEHVCQHDEYMKDRKIISFEREPSPIEATLNHEKQLRREHKAANWQPIRILTDYSNLQVTAAFQTFIQQKLIPPTLGFLSNAYTVYPKATISEVIGQQKCGDFTIPTKHQRLGIPNYDLVLYVGALEATGQDWLARAGPCILDKQTGRPVAGTVQFNTFYLSKVNFANAADTSWFSWIQTTIHECTHVLAFSNALFKYYINPGTNKQLGEAAVSTTAYDRSWVVLPNVVKQAQTYYNCPNAWGAPLENNGGQGTAGSHWERTTFGNEAMTGSDFPGAVFSVFTFKLLEGSGWYLPNYNYAQPFIWGMGEGCPLEQGACPTTGTAEFCNSTQDLCSVDYMGSASCSKTDPLAPGCSYWVEYGNMDCRAHSKNLDQITKYTGGYVGSGSRCWVTTLPTAVGFQNVWTSCYNSQCAAGQITVTVGTQQYTCTQDGQVLNIKFSGYSGKITCPPIKRFCAYENECPNDCSGRGTCLDKTCQCWAGFTGSDCSSQG